MKRLLHNLRVLNTRPQGQNAPLSQAIRDAGGIAIELPTIKIEATQTWVRSLPDLSTIQKAIFISANAVEHYFSVLKQQQILWPDSIEIIAIGKASANALQQLHIRVNEVPEQANSEHVLALNTLTNPGQQNILLIKGEGGRPLIEETLTHKGANLHVLRVYQRTLPKINHQFIKSIWHDDLVDIILLTSEQSINHLFQLFEEEAHTWLRNKTCLVLSERLAEAASSLGIKNIIRSHPDGIMDSLFDYVTKD
ncbi:MAG: uroporphyrinogen-III synthase [Legionella sp.]|uniref:uroporphyrinogen-III synthase n=1 Tax=Legionella sp. TaxID=459 RepID=UPI0039E39C91